MSDEAVRNVRGSMKCSRVVVKRKTTKQIKENRYQQKREKQLRIAYARMFPHDILFENFPIAQTSTVPNCSVTIDRNRTVTNATITDNKTTTTARKKINGDVSMVSERRQPGNVNCTSNCDAISRPVKRAKVSIRTSDDSDENDDNQEPENNGNAKKKVEVDEEDDVRNEEVTVELRLLEEKEEERVNEEEKGEIGAEGVVEERVDDEEEEEDEDYDQDEEEEEEEEEYDQEEEEEEEENDQDEGNETNGTAVCYDDNNDDENIFTCTKMRSWSQELTLKPNTTNVDVIAPILANAVRSNLTYECLMRSLRNEGNKYIQSGIPRTITGLWALLARNDEAIVKRYYYCDDCESIMGNCARTLIDCDCGKYKPNGKTKLIPYFIQVRLAPQLRQLLQTPTIYNALQYRRTRTKKDVSNMEDMYDGDKYKEMTSTVKDFLSNVDNFSLTINTDGCSVANSSNASAWPILLQINELPPHLRKRNILLGGIWVAATHPHLNTILQPTVQELQELYKIGIVWKDPVDGHERVSKIVTTVCSVDTPARSDVLNMTRFNGKHGCTFCLQEGKTMTGKPGQRVYPVSASTKLRNDEDIRNDMREAHLSKSGKRVNGVIGVSTLAILYEFDLQSGMVVESMHNVYLGVVRFHTRLLFQGKATDKWYCGSPTTISAINAELNKIRRPSKISRSTRSLNVMNNWKANEWRNWILYYAIICLQGHIADSHVEHMAMLSRAVYIYNKDSISVHELEEARSLINKYVEKFQNTFGDTNMRYNVHLLTHLPDTVQNWGPLWAHSAFPFESWNKKIIDRVTSANARPLQIVTRQMMYNFMESLLYEPFIKESTKESIISTLYGGTKKGRKHGKHLNDDAFKFQGNGKPSTRAPMNWESQALHAAGMTNVQSLTSYRSATIRGLNYKRHEESTTKTKRYSDEYIHCALGFARIVDVVKCNNDNNEIVHGFFVNLMTSVSNITAAKHIHCVELSTDSRFICVDDEAPKPAVRIIHNELEFAIALSNVWESD